MKKKSGAGKFVRGLASSALGAASGNESSSLIQVDEVDEYSPAVILRFFNQNNIPAGVVARWFDYNPDNGEQHWSDNTLNERGLQSLSVVEQGRDNETQLMAASAKAMNLTPNTFVIVTNLRFRSNKAIMAEAQALANAVGSQFGAIGALAAQGAGAAARAGMGDGFSVQADSYLFRLVWNEDVEGKINDVFTNNGSLEDLIATGACTLEYVGKEKASACVRQSILSDKPIADLVERATTRAIDASIAKLQEKNDVFRSVFPISSVAADGTLQVKIGTREGVSKGDTYAVLERREDPNTGAISYKEIATVKPNEKLIWNNLAGAQEEAAENAAHSEGNSDEFNNDAVSLGATTFVGKKGKDYSGCFIQLKKKK